MSHKATWNRPLVEQHNDGAGGYMGQFSAAGTTKDADFLAFAGETDDATSEHCHFHGTVQTAVEVLKSISEDEFSIDILAFPQKYSACRLLRIWPV